MFINKFLNTDSLTLYNIITILIKKEKIMASIRVKKDEDISRAIKRFKRKVEKEGIMKEVKRRRYYLKPSERKKEKRIAAAKRRRKVENRMRQKKR